MMNDFIYKFPFWLKKNLFNTPTNSIISFFVLAIFVKLLGVFFDYFFVSALWDGTASACRESGGFCYPFIREKIKFILFGFYPSEALWRPIVGMLQLFLTLFLVRDIKKFKAIYLFYIALSFVLYVFLMRGGAGLSVIENDKWGGLPLTIMLSFIGIFFAYPIGILLALARRSNLAILKTLAVIYIELIRGVPLISVLFMSSVMFPLFLPQGLNIDKLLRAQVAIIMFVSAYMAEVIRGGLQAIEKGQYEASESLGLNYFQTMYYVIIPQALRLVVPPTINTAIGMFKDTSLVLVIALFDLLNTAKSSLRDPEWLGFSLEVYIFVGIIYFVFCRVMSRYAKKLESDFNTNHN